MRHLLIQISIALVVTFMSINVAAYENLVKKNKFELPFYTTVGGKTIHNLKVGWEAYGKLNKTKSNVILICHYFTGSSHAAGRYSRDDKVSGYWNAIIGSGKAIDTDKFYVISVDSLANLNTGDPNVITTGPASLNPKTGKPYGLNFPIVTIRDFVNVQKALIDKLGIKKLHAVIGPSMGALQTYEWASAYPEMVASAIPVIGSGWASGNLVAWLNVWATPIKLDSNWNEGDYYEGEPPLDGLAAALKTVTLHAQHWEWANSVYGRTWANKEEDPLLSFDNRFKIETDLDALGMARAKRSDANHFLYLVKANQLFFTGHNGNVIEGLKRISVPMMIIYSEKDLIFFPEEIRETATLIRSNGTPVELVEIQGSRGHLDGVLSIVQVESKIRAFLE